MTRLESEIEHLKCTMIEAAQEYGYIAPETISISQALDEKLNEYRRAKDKTHEH